MIRDDPLLVRRDDVAGDARPLAGDQWSVLGICSEVEIKAEPRKLPDHLLAYRRCVLTDARREYKAVDAAHCRRGHARRQDNAIDEAVEPKLRPRVRAPEQYPHIVAHA